MEGDGSSKPGTCLNQRPCPRNVVLVLARPKDAWPSRGLGTPVVEVSKQTGPIGAPRGPALRGKEASRHKKLTPNPTVSPCPTPAKPVFSFKGWSEPCLLRETVPGPSAQDPPRL